VARMRAIGAKDAFERRGTVWERNIVTLRTVTRRTVTLRTLTLRIVTASLRQKR